MNPLAVLMPGFTGTELPAWLEQRLRDGLAGVCLFATNVESPAQVRALTDRIYAANPHAVVSIDEEGGDVTRLHQRLGSPFPGNAVLGRLDDLSLTRAVGEQVGRELRGVGVNLALAPDVDVNSDPRNPVIGVRSFGADAALVARHAAAWVEGLQSQGVAADAKHFPGHGDTSQDSHVSLPTVSADRDTLSVRELAPFAAAIEAGVATIMSSHIMVPALDPERPSTFSPRILGALLREDMGFDGVIVSDALDMVGASGEIGIPRAAVRALAAGCDLLCIGTDNTDDQLTQIVDEIAHAITTGSLSAARIDDAQSRLRRMTEAFPAAEARHGDQGMVPGVVPGVTTDVVHFAFAVNERASAARSRAADRALRWIALESEANIAVGDAPWGPFADGAQPGAGLVADARLTPDADLAAVVEQAAAWADAGDQVIVVGKDIHRHPWARAAVEALRAHDAIAVDMGWPDLDDSYADVATFGASRLVGQALREWWS